MYNVQEKYAYSLFQVYGVELEYMVVNLKTLDVLPIVDLLFEDISGEITSSIEQGPLTLDNELALHVVEMKTTEPARSLEPLGNLFHKKVKEINALLAKRDACLMPTAMHPWMDPYKETKLWPHGSSEIYDAFNKIFDCRGHGWGNLQSAHINLPFGTEEEFVKLHRAIRLILPLIPTIAASSPFYEGKAAHMLDKRLDVYQTNCQKVFSVTGHIIPEVCTSYDDYQTKVLGRIYKDLAPLDPNGILKHEWVNARGAITRFERGSIEIRLIDIQENPFQDLAIVEAITRLIKYFIEVEMEEFYDHFSEERLKNLLLLGIKDAEEALITDLEYLALFGIEEPLKARDLWAHILSELIQVPKESRKALDLIISEGTLATRLVKRVGPKVTLDALKTTYLELCACLEKGQPLS